MSFSRVARRLKREAGIPQPSEQVLIQIPVDALHKLSVQLFLPALMPIIIPVIVVAPAVGLG